MIMNSMQELARNFKRVATAFKALRARWRAPLPEELYPAQTSTDL